MIVSIHNDEKLRELQIKTGKSASEIVDEILNIHLDEEKKADFVLSEMEGVFDQMKGKYGIRE